MFPHVYYHILVAFLDYIAAYYFLRYVDSPKQNWTQILDAEENLYMSLVMFSASMLITMASLGR